MSVELESKTRIDALISAANSKTGGAAADLTTAVQALCDGFGRGGLEKIFEAEFTLDTTITTSGYTTIATIETGFSESDFEIGEILIVEIQMIEDLETDETLMRQLDKLHFLTVGGGGYMTCGYSLAVTYGYNPNTETALFGMYGAGGIFVYQAAQYIKTLIVAGRQNGSPSPVAGRYRLLLYKTGANGYKDYLEG